MGEVVDVLQGRKVCAAAATLLLVAAAPAAADPIVNGGFETPADGCVAQYDQGQSLGGWLVGPGNVDHVGTSCLWVPSEGNETVDLNASDKGGVSQVVPTTTGAQYQLHYALSGNFYGPPAVKRGNAHFGATSVGFTFDTTGKTLDNPGWVCPTYGVTASASSSKISFASTTLNPGSNNWYGPVIDDVRLLDGAAPTVTKVLPQVLGQGARRLVSVMGTNLGPDAVVAIGGTGVSVTGVDYVGPTKVYAHVVVSASAPVEARDVAVTRGGATDTCGHSLMIAAGPKPTSASPSSGARGATVDVHVMGSGFVSGAKVTFSGTGLTVNSTSFASSGELVANTTIAPGAATGARTVVVTNPDGGVGKCTGCFSVTT